MRSHVIWIGVLAALLFAGLTATPALAADIHQFPDVGAPGDPVVLKGEDFDDDPVVKFGGVEAEVIRATGHAILCLVPDDADEGEVTVTVDGTATDSDFLVVPEGSPVVLRMSAHTATPGMRIFLVGRRLHGGTASFVDSEGETQATADLRGRRHAAVLVVPDDLDAGTYALVIENEDGLDTGDGSPEIVIEEEGTPELTAVSPEDARPGDHVKLAGTDLGPGGPVRVEWTDSAGTTLVAHGWSNGYDVIHSFVPLKASPGATYEIVAVLRGGHETSGVVKYEVGSLEEPVVTEIRPDEGPAGSVAKIAGENLFAFGEKPVVTFELDGEAWRAHVIGGLPGFGKHDDMLAILVPKDLDDGEYDVTVTVGDETSDPVTFTVGAPELTVTDLRPDHQGTRGANRPVAIKGTGFGDDWHGPDLSVIWDDGETERAGRVIFRTDRLLLVLPPGGRSHPLPEGKYDVKVVLDPDGTPDSASAGTYTVS